MTEKVVVITGAGSGLGASLAKKYSAFIMYVYLDEQKKGLEMLLNH